MYEIQFVSLSVCSSFLSRLHPLGQSGETMLIGAVRGGHVEIVRALLNKYADIDVRGQVTVPLPLSLLVYYILRRGVRPSCILCVICHTAMQYSFSSVVSW